MKKTIHPLIVISIIIVLSLFIILPPTLRAFYPKVEKTKSAVNDKVTLLICTKSSEIEQLTVKSQTRYINNKITENRITFSKIAASRETPTTEMMLTEQTPTITTELEFLKQIPNIKIAEQEEATTITITEDTLKQNPNISELTNYFNKNINTQKISYVQKSYSCETTTS